LCSSDSDCGGGYYCAKTNYSPNYNVENFDNIFWAFLNVFDIISLEGWSYTQVDVQSTMSVVAFIYFWIVVLIGTFLCINLTLAVINAKFTEANNDFKREEQAKKEAEA
jgi:predicted membrane protein